MALAMYVHLAAACLPGGYLPLFVIVLRHILNQAYGTHGF